MRKQQKKWKQILINNNKKFTVLLKKWYEKGAIVMFEPGKPVTGHNALRQAFTQFVNLNPNYTFFSHEVYI